VIDWISLGIVALTFLGVSAITLIALFWGEN